MTPGKHALPYVRPDRKALRKKPSLRLSAFPLLKRQLFSPSLSRQPAAAAAAKPRGGTRGARGGLSPPLPFLSFPPFLPFLSFPPFRGSGQRPAASCRSLPLSRGRSPALLFPGLFLFPEGFPRRLSGSGTKTPGRGMFCGRALGLVFSRVLVRRVWFSGVRGRAIRLRSTRSGRGRRRLRRRTAVRAGRRR